MIKNKKGNLAVTLLVFMTLLIAGIALFTFNINLKENFNEAADFSYINELETRELFLSYYIENIIDNALKNADKDKLEEDIKIKLVEELNKYKYNGIYKIPELEKIEQQILNFKIENGKLYLEVKLVLNYKDKEIELIKEYSKTFERQIV